MATGNRSKSRISGNGKPSAAEQQRRSRQSAKSKAAKPQAERLDHEWANILEHEAAINQEYAGLLQQQQAITAEIERVQKIANQIVGRKDQIMELRGEKEPLPTVAELMKARAEQSGIPAATGEEQAEESED